MSDDKTAQVRYVGMERDELIVLMPDGTHQMYKVGDTLTTTEAHAKQLCESESWKPAKPGKKEEV